MTSRNAFRWIGVSCGCGLALLGLASLNGCKDNTPPPAPYVPPPPPPAPPPAPTFTPVADLMTKYNIDERVRLPEELAPETDDARVALLQFYDGFVRGDANKVGQMLSPLDKFELDAMVGSGQFARAVEGITRVDVRCGRHPQTGDPATLAVFYVGATFQPQLWTYKVETTSATFEAEATPPGIMDQLSGTDWITAWYKVLDGELAIAERPDEIIVPPKQNFDNGDRDGRTSVGGAPGSPGGVGGGKHKPPADPIQPPGLPTGPGQ